MIFHIGLHTWIGEGKRTDQIRWYSFRVKPAVTCSAALYNKCKKSNEMNLFLLKTQTLWLFLSNTFSHVTKLQMAKSRKQDVWLVITYKLRAYIIWLVWKHEQRPMFLSRHECAYVNERVCWAGLLTSKERAHTSDLTLTEANNITKVN